MAFLDLEKFCVMNVSGQQQQQQQKNDNNIF